MAEEAVQPKGFVRRGIRRAHALMNRHRHLVGAVLLAALALAAAYASLWHYPRIVRSAYYRNPWYVCRAVAAECRGRAALPKARAIARVEQVGLVPTGRARFLWLADEPDRSIDKPIIRRYFGLLAKLSIKTETTSFWEIPVGETGLAFVEVDTGRVIHLDDTWGTTSVRYYPEEE